MFAAFLALCLALAISPAPALASQPTASWNVSVEPGTVIEYNSTTGGITVSTNTTYNDTVLLGFPNGSVLVFASQDNLIPVEWLLVDESEEHVNLTGNYTLMFWQTPDAYGSADSVLSASLQLQQLGWVVVLADANNTSYGMVVYQANTTMFAAYLVGFVNYTADVYLDGALAYTSTLVDGSLMLAESQRTAEIYAYTSTKRLAVYMASAEQVSGSGGVNIQYPTATLAPPPSIALPSPNVSAYAAQLAPFISIAFAIAAFKSTEDPILATTTATATLSIMGILIGEYLIAAIAATLATATIAYKYAPRGE